MLLVGIKISQKRCQIVTSFMFINKIFRFHFALDLSPLKYTLTLSVTHIWFKNRILFFGYECEQNQIIYSLCTYFDRSGNYIIFYFFYVLFLAIFCGWDPFKKLLFWIEHFPVHVAISTWRFLYNDNIVFFNF